MKLLLIFLTVVITIGYIAVAVLCSPRHTVDRQLPLRRYVLIIVSHNEQVDCARSRSLFLVSTKISIVSLLLGPGNG